jgi:6-pyruvoyltetrahydropterin/6-carboxytetrahydropterin synthase
MGPFPFAHRQPNHDGHCALIHGHNWDFEFEFEASELDDNGFVIDFGRLNWLKEYLDDRFDHKLVLNEDDPWLEHLKMSLTVSTRSRPELADITVVANCGAEGLAKSLFEQVIRRLELITDGRVILTRVTVFEDIKNSATYAQ